MPADPNPGRCDCLKWLSLPLIVLIAVALHYTVKPLFGEYVQDVTINAAIAVIMAVSLNIVNGFTGQFSIGHAAFYAIGGYAAAAVTFYGSIALYDSSAQMPILSAQTLLFVAATVIGGLVAAAAGWIVGMPSLRLKGDYLAIVTLGFGEILRILLQQTNKQLFSREEIHAAKFGDIVPPPLGGALGFINTPKVTTLFWATLLTGITILVAWRLKKSTFGRSMIAVRENEIAAESMGVNVTRLKVWAFVIGAFFAGTAGSLYAHKLGTTIGPKTPASSRASTTSSWSSSAAWARSAARHSPPCSGSPPTNGWCSRRTSGISGCWCWASAWRSGRAIA
ncbi:MAG: branched-chain amino acid ABC transporter permease [Tepidisphaeraceae bacterium]